MVVAHVFREKPFQVALIQHDYVIEKIPSATLDPSLRSAVLPGALERGPFGFAVHRPHGRHHLRPKLLVAVKDQVFAGKLERKGLPELLDHPAARWMAGDVEV